MLQKTKPHIYPFLENEGLDKDQSALTEGVYQFSSVMPHQEQSGRSKVKGRTD